MTVLVTGAAGFLGSHLAELLVERGERPRVLLRPGESIRDLPQRNVEVCRGDVSDRAALTAAVRGVDRILHCAARTGPWGPQEEYERSNVTGLKNLVEVALAAGVRRVVHVSSISVHGNDLRGAGDESSPFRLEANPYNRSKIQGEQLLQSVIHEREAPVTIVRPGLIYGPRDRASFARFATMIEHNKMVVIGSGTNHLPLIYVRDVARGILLASDVPEAVGRAYVLVNDEPVTQRDYLSAIAAELGVPAPTRHIPYRFALAMGAAVELAAHLAHRHDPPPLTRFGLELMGGENRFSIARARRELGFVPQVNLIEGVRASVEWYRASVKLSAA